MNFWQEFRARWGSETPPFFKKLRAYATYWASGFAAGYASLKLDAIRLNKRFDQPMEDGLALATLVFVTILGGTFLPTMNKTILQAQEKEVIKEDTIEKTKEVIADKIADNISGMDSNTIKKEVDKKD